MLRKFNNFFIKNKSVYEDSYSIYLINNYFAKYFVW